MISHGTRPLALAALLSLAACSARGGSSGPGVFLDGSTNQDGAAMDSLVDPDALPPDDSALPPVDSALPPEDHAEPPRDTQEPVDRGLPPVDRPTSPVCGNLSCDTGETCSSCPRDCGPCPVSCGDGTCGSGETCTTCPGDCGKCAPTCGDGVCAASESCSSCPDDCGPCDPGCADFSTCAECRASTRCGFCTNTGACVAGNLVGPTSAVSGCTASAGTWIAGSSSTCPTTPSTDITVACAGGSFTGSTRNCSWRREAVHSCTAGTTVRVGCATGTGCGLGSCTGDAVLRVCAGSVSGCAYPGLVTADDTCGTCPYGTFTCPTGGQYTVFHGSYSSTTSGTCTIGVSP